MKRTVKDLVNLKGKVVLLRVDFNVPIDDTGRILDKTRIINALPTIKYLIKEKARVVLLSHLDRPKGYDIRKSLWPIAMMLMKLLPCNVDFSNSVIGEEAKGRIANLKEGNVLLLENTRFYEGETKCDMEFAREIASMGDLFVNDAFGAAHRKNASNYGLARLLPNAMGLLMEKEVETLSKSIEDPKHPFVAVLGGAKVNTKINILKQFIEKADVVLIGGAMAYTFLEASGKTVGASMVDEDCLDVAEEILEFAKEKGKKIYLPVDHLAVSESDRRKQIVSVTRLKGDLVGYDIGTQTSLIFAREIAKAKQIFWNGPMGMFERSIFANGTNAIAEAVAKSKAYSVVGGGDTVSALNKLGLAKSVNFISTGGGATMEFLEQGSLPCIDVIQEKLFDI